MIVDEGQETPLHFHWSKIEDIIVRGGGRLALELYGSTPEGGLADAALRVRVDGISREIAAGGEVVLGPGESICLERGVYHRFYARARLGQGPRRRGQRRERRLERQPLLGDVGRFPEVERGRRGPTVSSHPIARSIL